MAIEVADQPWWNDGSVEVLASASRTTTQNVDLVNHCGQGIHVVLDTTVIGTGSVTVSIKGYDPASGKYYTLLAGAAVTTNTTKVYSVFPGATAATNVTANDFVPRNFRITVTANNANAAVYSVGASVLR